MAENVAVENSTPSQSSVLTAWHAVLPLVTSCPQNQLVRTSRVEESLPLLHASNSPSLTPYLLILR